MSNDFYTKSGIPSTGAPGSSAVVRAEFSAIQAAFDKMPSLNNGAGQLVRVNAGGTALEDTPLTAGQILYGGANNTLAQSNNLVWNTANNTLAITGSVSANGSLSASGPSAGGTSAAVTDFTGGTARLISVGCNAATRGTVQVIVAGAGGANALVALGIDSGGNTALNNLNAGIIQSGPLIASSSSGTGGAGNSTIRAGNGAAGQSSVRVNGDSGNNNAPVFSLFRSGISETILAVLQNGTTVLSSTGGLASYNDATLNSLSGIKVDTTGNTSLSNLNITGALRGTSAMMSPLNNSLAANVVLNNTSVFFDGPSVAQGSNGTWFASGTVVIVDSGGSSSADVKLWDGTTVIDSAQINTTNATARYPVSLSGYISAPAGNIRISAKSTSLASNIVFNVTGLAKDSTITAIRIG